MVDVVDLAEGELNRQLATLVFAEIEPSGPSEAIQAVTWWNLLARLGLQVPLMVVHDLGQLLTQVRSARPQRIRPLPMGGESIPLARARYRGFLEAVAQADLVDTLGTEALHDQTIAVVLARALHDVFVRWPGRPRWNTTQELPLVSEAYARPRNESAKSWDPAWAWPFVQRLVEFDRAVLARLEQIDVSALRLLGLFSVEGGLPDLADLYQVVGALGAADIVEFSLRLLPSLLETKRRRSVQRFAIDGYASIERRGPLDALLPSELAVDEDIFAVRALSDDLLYYGRERAPDAGRRLNYILVDASASMRGARQVFARGLALALCKKLSLLGGDVWLRFFDSRLYERLDIGRFARRDLPRLLTFRSERGRNYARVFADLLADVERLRREDGRDIAITFITHAECSIPLATVESLTRLASVYGIFVLPSREVTMDYWTRLHRHQLVTPETLASTSGTTKRALDIVDDVAAGAGIVENVSGEAVGDEAKAVRRAARGTARGAVRAAIPLALRASALRSAREGRGPTRRRDR